MGQKSINLFHIPFSEIFNLVHTAMPQFEYDYQKHAVRILNESHDQVGFLRLPLHVNVTRDLELVNDGNTVLYLTVESGNAAICVMKGKSNVYHTTFSAYMTRKKQGFSQIKYLNKKGKSRAGSRMRLAATNEFFEEINIKLTELDKSYDFSRLAINCSATLIPYLFNSKEPCPFDKKDERMYKIPLHISSSNYTHLDGAIKKLMAPILTFEEKDGPYFEPFLVTKDDEEE